MTKKRAIEMDLQLTTKEIARYTAEIRNQPNPEEVRAIQAMLKTMGFGDWCLWKECHSVEVQQFIKASAEERASSQFRELKPLIYFAAYETCLESFTFISGISLSKIDKDLALPELMINLFNAYHFTKSHYCSRLEWPYEGENPLSKMKNNSSLAN